MHPGEFIRDRRVALGLEPEDVAQQVGLNVSSYYDLEQVETELQSVVSLAEIARLENLLGFDVRTTLSGWKGPATLTLQDLAEVTKAHLQRTNQAVEEFENAVGWEVRPMLANPNSALDWNPDCLRDVCKAVDVSWESINFEGSLHVTR